MNVPHRNDGHVEGEVHTRSPAPVIDTSSKPNAQYPAFAEETSAALANEFRNFAMHRSVVCKHFRKKPKNCFFNQTEGQTSYKRNLCKSGVGD